jgi:hypothetical protein
MRCLLRDRRDEAGAIRALVAAVLIAPLLIAVTAGPAPAQESGNGDATADGAADDAAAETDAVAKVTFASGRNRIRRAGGRLERLSVDTEVQEGDEITMSRSGRATLVYLATGLYRSLSAGEKLTVTAAQAEASDDADVQKVDDAMAANLREQQETSLAGVGGTRSERVPGQPFAIAPVHTTLPLADSLTFRWLPPLPAPAGPVEYRVVLMRAGQVLTARTTTDTALTIDREQAGIAPGELITWYVTRVDRPVVPQAKPMVKLLGPEATAALNRVLARNATLAAGPDDPAPLFLDAEALTAVGAFSPALDRLVRLYAATPGDPGVIARLTRLYTRMRFARGEITALLRDLRDANPGPLAPTGVHFVRQRDDGITLQWTSPAEPAAAALRIWSAPRAPADADRVPDGAGTVAADATSVTLPHAAPVPGGVVIIVPVDADGVVLRDDAGAPVRRVVSWASLGFAAGEGRPAPQQGVQPEDVVRRRRLVRGPGCCGVACGPRALRWRGRRPSACRGRIAGTSPAS